MDNRLRLWVGSALLLLGAAAVASNMVAYLLGPSLWRLPWRFWPLAVVALGLFLMGAPIVARRRRLEALFVLGMPVLVGGAVLLFSSVLGAWRAWRWLWPLEMLATAFGLLVVALSRRTLWILVPAIIIGTNGLLLQFCAITSWWRVWSVLWTSEPLSVGLGLLAIGFSKQSMRLIVAAAAMLGLGGIALIGMMSVVSLRMVWAGSWLLSLMPSFIIAVAGLLVLILSLLHGSVATDVAAQ